MYVNVSKAVYKLTRRLFYFQGLCIAIPGPTLLDLSARTRTDIEQISRVFTGRSVGYLGGSILGGM